ncbi:MAG: tRNA-specific 2-thiouridylase MnmA [Acidimicrobiales bacterium]|nr:MAG: tRNA-specific 2-thiouridylase MnmA [Acidimicrobiales bacterium]
MKGAEQRRRRVLVAMSGGVDSSVAAALLAQAGHEVCGVTLKLWGGEQDTGCCSIDDVEDARRVARRLGIEHLVFNLAELFQHQVVDTYVESHRRGETPNPCIECNRHIKFDALLRRALVLGFDSLATGHHARVVEWPDGSRRVARGLDRAKDQSYVLGMLDSTQLRHLEFPVGALTKAEVRRIAADLGLPTASKPDSQDVCFIPRNGGRRRFLADRIELTPAAVCTPEGEVLGSVPAAQLVTVGQRRGLGIEAGEPRYVLSVDTAERKIVVGTLRDLHVRQTRLRDVVWVDDAVAERARTGLVVEAQTSAHGKAAEATVTSEGGRTAEVLWDRPRPRVAPGQSVVFYEADTVVGSGIAEVG